MMRAHANAQRRASYADAADAMLPLLAAEGAGRGDFCRLSAAAAMADDRAGRCAADWDGFRFWRDYIDARTPVDADVARYAQQPMPFLANLTAARAGALATTYADVMIANYQPGYDARSRNFSAPSRRNIYRRW